MMLSKIVHFSSKTSYESFLSLRAALSISIKNLEDFKSSYLPKPWYGMVHDESLAAAFTVYSHNVYLDSFGDRLLDLMVDHFKWINERVPKKKLKNDSIEKLRTYHKLKELASELGLHQWMVGLDHEGKITSARKETSDVMEGLFAAIFTNLDYQKTFQFLMSIRFGEAEYRISSPLELDHFLNSRRGDYAKKEYHRFIKMFIRSLEEKPVFLKISDSQIEFDDHEKMSKRAILQVEPGIMNKINGYSSHFDRVQRYGFQNTWNELYLKRNEVLNLIRDYRNNERVMGERVNEFFHDVLLSLGSASPE
jgi:hypothetical protein